MTSKKISITTEFLATLKNMDKVVADIDKGLSNTKIDLSKNNSFTKLISNFKDEYTKFLSLTKNNEVDLLDAKEVEKSAEKILKTFRELETKYGNLSKISMENAKKLFPENFSVNVDKATRAIDNFKKSASNLGIKTQELDVEEKKLANLKNQLDEISNTKIKSDFDEDIKKAADNIKVADEALTNFLENLKKTKTSHINLPVLKGKVTRLTNKRDRELPELKKQIAEKETKRSSLGRTSADNEQRKKLNEEIGILQTQVKKLEDDVRTAQKELDNKTKEKQDIEKNIDKFKTGKGNESSLTNKEAKEYNNLTNSLNNAKNAQAQLIAEQKKAYDSEEVQTAAINKKNLEIENQQIKINKLKETISSLSQNSDYDNLFKSLQSLGVNTEGIEHTAEGLEEIVKSLEKADAQALENIRTKLAEMGVEADDAENYVEQVIQELHGFKNTTQAIKENEQELSRLRQQIISFFSIDNAIQLFKRSVRSAYETVKELDAAMTETAVVTDFSVGDMWDQLPRYTKAANELGTTTLGAYQTMTLFYQQGLKTNEVFEIGTETMKMARIAGMQYEDATNKMTAALRGFNMELNETSAQRVNDVYSELAAITAADTNEIATAMTKTASIADSANMKFETTAAFLSQIIETTRESAETAGTAMKTVVARFQELKKDPAEIGEVDGEIVDANKIETALRTINVALRDTSGQFRDLDDVFLEIASKWDTLDTNTQRYIATMAAGSRQQSRFIAMMSNYDRTMELVNAANNSAGASQRQFEKTTESLESKLNKLKNAWDAFTMGITNSTLIKTGVDLLTGFLSILNKLIDGISGESGLIKAIASIGIAWGGLKLGGNILKKLGFGDTLIGQGFSKLFPKKDGEKAGETLAESIKKGFKRASKKGEGLGLKGFFTNSNLDKDFDELVINLGKKRKKLLKENDDFREEYLNSLKINNSQFSDSQLLEVQMEFDTNGIEAANAKVKEFGGTIKVTDGMIEKSGGSLSKLSLNYQTAGTAAIAAGTAFMTVGNILSDAGYEEAGKTLQILGTTIASVGTAMMVLPKIAKAIGVSFTTAGIKTGTAGVIAGLGWAWVTLIIIGIAALVAGVVSLGKAIKDSSDAGKLEKLNKAVQQLAEEADRAKEEIDKITEAKNGLDELRKSFEGLTVGTSEWKKALIDSNQQILELINKYPELSYHITKGEYGQLDIKDEGWDKLLEAQQKRYTAALTAQTGLSVQRSQIEQKVEYEKFISQATGESDTAKTIGTAIGALQGRAYGGLSGAGIGALIGKNIADEVGSWLTQASLDIAGFSDSDWGKILFPSAGLTNAITGLTNEEHAQMALTGGLTEKQFTEFLAKAASRGITMTGNKNAKEEFRELFNELGFKGNFEILYNKLENVGEELDQLSISAYKASEAQENYRDSIINTIASNDDIIQDSKYNNIAQNAVDRTYDNYNERLEEEIAKIEGNSEELKEKYAKEFDLYYENGKLYSDKDLQNELDLSDETMKSALASEALDKQIADSMKKFISVLDAATNNLQKRGRTSEVARKEVKAFSNLVSDEGGDLTQNQIDLIKVRIDSAKGETEEERVTNYIKELGFSSLEEAGFNNYEEVIENLRISSEVLANAFANLPPQITATESFTQLTGNMSASQADAFGKKLHNIFIESGADAEQVNKAINSINETFKGASEEELATIYEVLKNLNWNDALQWEQLDDQLKAMGISFNSVKLEDFTQDMIDLNNAVKNVDIEKLKESLVAVQKIIKDINTDEQNRTFSAEDYKTIIAADAKLANDFVMNLDGNYNYIGSQMGNLVLALQDNTKALLGKTLDQLNAKIGATEIIEDMAARFSWDSGEVMAELANRQDWETDESASSATGFLRAFIELANEREVDLSSLGIEGLSNTTSIESFANVSDIYKILDQLQDIREQNPDNVAARDDLNINAAAMAAQNNNIVDNSARSRKLLTQMETATEDEFTGLETEFQGISAAIASQAIDLGVSETKISEYTKALDILNNSTDRTSKEYENAKEFVLKFQEEVANTASLKYSQKALQGNVEAIIELLNGYEDLADEASKIEQVQKMADTLDLGIKVDESNYEEVRSLLLGVAQNSYEAFTQLLTLSGQEFGITITAEGKFDAFKEQIAEANSLFNQWINNMIQEGAFVEEEVDLSSKADYIGGMLKEEFPDGSIKYTPITETTKLEAGMTIIRPAKAGEIKTVTNSSGGGSNYKPSGKSTKSSGGSSKSWENPYDKFYNLTETINKNLREREKLERTYNKLLREQQHILNTIDYEKNLSDQINNLKQQANKLRREYALQFTMYSGKGNELQSYMAKNSSMRKYGYYDAASQQIVIDWNTINKVKNDEKGQKIEDYISKLEELRDAMWDAEDAMLDAEEQIEEMKEDLREKLEELKQAYLDFEDRIVEALVAQRQAEIDELQEVYDLMSESNNSVLSAIQEVINEQRRLRELEEQKADIEEMQRRLAMLRQDTSGASDLEIKALEEQIGDAQQSYTDSLIDQAIDEMGTANEKAEEQRQQQIDLLQHQLDWDKENGKFWTQVNELLSTAINPDGSLNNNSPLVELLKSTEGYKAMSEFGKQNWWTNLQKTVAEAMAGLKEWLNPTDVDAAIGGIQGGDAGIVGGVGSDNGGSSGGSGSGGILKRGSAVGDLQRMLNFLGFNAGKVDNAYGENTKAAVKRLQKYLNISSDGLYGKKTYDALIRNEYYYEAEVFKDLEDAGIKIPAPMFKTGGLADFTGPAWLDGTKSHPEIVLNARDTANFLELRDILRDMNLVSEGKTSGGDNYFEIHIEVDTLSNDYDVEQVADKVKRIINDDARYRNTNAINLIR